MFLFIHQLAGARSLWLPYIRGILELDQSYSDKQLIDLFTIPLPGHPDDDQAFAIEDILKSIDDFVSQKLSKQQELAKKLILTSKPEIIKNMKQSKLIIVGHELGGVVALEYALENINKVSKLVLVGCGNNFNSFFINLRKQYYNRVVYKKSLSQLKAKIQSSKNPRDKNFWSIFSENLSRKAIDSGLQILQEFNFLKSFNKLDLESQIQFTKLPVLLIRGQMDLYCTATSAFKLQQVLDLNKEIWRKNKFIVGINKLEPNITIKTYKMSGQNPMDKDPVNFVIDIRDFLRK